MIQCGFATRSSLAGLSCDSLLYFTLANISFGRESGSVSKSTVQHARRRIASLQFKPGTCDHWSNLTGKQIALLERIVGLVFGVIGRVRPLALATTNLNQLKH